MLKSSKLTKITIARINDPLHRSFGNYAFIKFVNDQAPISGFPLYWRLNNIGIVEIGLDPISGVLQGISVPAISYLHNIKTTIHPTNDVTIEYGFPCFSTSLWQKEKDPYNVRQYLFDENDDFEIEFNGQALRLLIGSDTVNHVVDVPGGLRLEFNHENKLVSFLIASISRSEAKVISDYISFHRVRRTYL